MSRNQTYIIGETLRITGVCSLDGTPTDPDTLTAKIIDPQGTSHEATVEAGEDGAFAVYYTPEATDPTGGWRMRVTATSDGNVEIEDTTFIVVS